MNPDGGLILPNIVPVENRLILSPEAQLDREAMLAAIEAEEADYDDLDVPDRVELKDRAKVGICHQCGHQKLLFLPALLCERCLRKAAEAAGLEMPAPATGRPMNRAERRKAARRGR